MLNKNSEIKPRFSIRKLSVGAASILIGLTIFGFSSKPVAAEQTNSASEQSEAAVTSDKQNKVENASDKTQTLNLNTNKDQAAPNAAALKESKAAGDTTASEKALVPDKNNTSSSTPKVNGKDGNSSITNVTSDGSITYDYSIDVKNKTTGEEESVHSGATGQDNRANLDPENASEINAHLILTNISDQDKVIGNTDYDDNPDHYDPTRHNNDEATLFINAWSGPNRTLKIDGSKAATLTLTKNGQVVANNSRVPLTVYYLASNGTWYTYQDMLTNFGQDAIRNVTQIGFKGILQNGVTADMSVPLVYDATAARTDNQISVNALNAKSIYVTAEKEPAKIWTDDEIKDDDIHPMVRNDDGSYSEVAEEADLIKLLPKAGEVVKITDSGNIFDTSNTTLYQGGQYEILLSAIQAVLGKYGYAVNVTRDNQNFASAYYYNTNPTAILKTADGQQIAQDSKSNPYFYIEVHKTLNTKDQTFQQGSSEAANWQYEQNVDSVFDEQFDHDVPTGYALRNIAAGKDTVFVVSLKDANGNEVANDRIDADTPAGTYTITLGHYINGQRSLLVTNTATITITPKPEQPTSPQPTTPEQPTNNPTTPTQPTTPVTPPTNPVKPTNPSQTSNAKPKPVKPAKPSHSQAQGQKHGQGPSIHNTQPKGQRVQNSIQPQKNEIHSQAFHPEKAIKTSTQARPLSEKNTRKANRLRSTKTLPQTGAEQTSKWGLIGLIVAALAALVSLATDRKHS